MLILYTIKNYSVYETYILSVISATTLQNLAQACIWRTIYNYTVNETYILLLIPVTLQNRAQMSMLKLFKCKILKFIIILCMKHTFCYSFHLHYRTRHKCLYSGFSSARHWNLKLYCLWKIHFVTHNHSIYIRESRTNVFAHVFKRKTLKLIITLHL